MEHPGSEYRSSSILGHSSSPVRDVNPSFAFLVHSQTTLPYNLPPDVDNKPLARQRRRRTSPEDAAVLEAAFLGNPKPDRAARCSIASRVALGEKEVQIWFQNRRSTTRRRAQPPAPYDSSPNLSHCFGHPTTGHEGSSLPCHCEDSGNVETASRPNDTTTLSEPSSSNVPTSPTTQSLSSPQQPQISSGKPTNDVQIMHDVQQQQPSLQQVPASPDRQSGLQRKRSKVRLSMTSDGNATILGEDEPSPPRERRQPATEMLHVPSLRRSYSAAGLNDGLDSIVPKRSLRRAPSGRSRDARTWEFWCDKDTRNELVNKAEQEQIGSATDAIQFIRSNSRKALALNRSGSNSQKLLSAGKKLDVKHARNPGEPSLQRAQSSLARLQSPKSMQTENGSKAHDKPKQIDEQPGSDSDKENRDPDGFDTRHEQRRTPAAVKGGERPVLRQSHTAPTSTNRHRSTRRTVDNASKRTVQDPEQDQEIADFMRPTSSNTQEGEPESSQAEDDLDCIQGLLSLSQGNWR